MNVGSLFSGIGGMDYGLAAAGHRHVFFCEWDEWRRQVLAARWPGIPVYDDVRAVGVEPTERAAEHGRGPGGDGTGRVHADAVPDLLCGGFPCQDLSVAGKRRGLAGERSGLFFEFARVIDAFRPGWVLVENVPGLLSSNGGRDFGVVLGTLADLGYGVGWRVLDSRFFGVPQRRRRVFIVGARADGDPAAAAGRAGEVLAVGSRCDRHPAAGGKAGEDVAVASLSGLGSGGPDDNDAQGGRVIDVAYALRKDPGGTGQGHNTNYVAAPLTKGSASGEGVNAPGRRQEDDVNLVPYTFDWQAGGSGDTSWRGKSRQWIDDKPGGPARSLVKNKTLAVHITQDPISGEQSPPMGKGNGEGCATIGVPDGVGVRRLTPIECERLQGLPDDWTRLDEKTPDSRRYSALGDAVTATVAEWIGRRLS